MFRTTRGIRLSLETLAMLADAADSTAERALDRVVDACLTGAPEPEIYWHAAWLALDADRDPSAFVARSIAGGSTAALSFRAQ